MALDRWLERVAELAKIISPRPAAPAPLVEAEEVEEARVSTSDPEDAEIVGSDRFENEPLPTRTMARILAAQGHHRRALEIYDRLVASAPEDVDLKHETERVREALEAVGDST